MGGSSAGAGVAGGRSSVKDFLHVKVTCTDMKGIVSSLDDSRLLYPSIHERRPGHRRVKGTHAVLSHFRSSDPGKGGRGSSSPHHGYQGASELSLRARHWAKRFTSTITFAFLADQFDHQSHFRRRGNGGLEKFSNWPRVSKLVNVKIQILLDRESPLSVQSEDPVALQLAGCEVFNSFLSLLEPPFPPP